MKTALKPIQDKIIGWRKKPVFWLLLTVGIIVFAGYFYRDLVIQYACLAVDWFFEEPEHTRNVIYFFTAVVGTCLLFWRTIIAKREANASEKNNKITEWNIKTIDQKAINNQISQATEELTNKNSSIRSNGLSDLKEIAKKNEDKREKIMQILSNHTHDLAPRDLTKENQISLTDLVKQKNQIIWLPSIERQEQHKDIQNIIKALSSIGRLCRNEELIDLSGTDLSGLSLFGFELINFSLWNTNLTSADLTCANLTGANLTGANLTGANFSSANLTDVSFRWSNFKDTRLNKANVSNADFEGVECLTAEQMKEAFCWEGEPPRNLPRDLDPPPMKEKP